MLKRHNNPQYSCPLLDVSVSGSQWISAASPSLSHLIRANARRVSHPTKENKTLWDAMDDKGPYTNGALDNFAAMNEKQEYGKSKHEELPIDTLGSGSDFTVFLQRLGVASMDQSFAATPSDPVSVILSVILWGVTSYKTHTTL